MPSTLTNLLLGVSLVTTLHAQDDKYQWLEDVMGEKSLAWVKEANAQTSAKLEGTAEYKALEADLLKILDSKARIPMVTKAGNYFYNLWQDADHPRGLWRRTTLAEYRKAEPRWETVLDIDALGKAEKKGWVFKGAQFLRPQARLCLVSLSPGGSDAVEVREFDVEAKAFVKGGFQTPLAKTNVDWVDANTLFVGTDFGKGTLTTSGYARQARRWKRGTPLASAEVVFEGLETDMAASANHDDTPGFERDLLIRTPTFFTNEYFLLNKDGSRTKLDVPADAHAGFHREWFVVQPRTAWTVGGHTYAGGSLLVIKADAFLKGERTFDVLFEPTPASSLAGVAWTRHRAILHLNEDVKNRLVEVRHGKGGWTRKPLTWAPAIGTLALRPVDADTSDDCWLVTSDFQTPTTLSLVAAGKAPERLKALPALFDASKLETTQHFAVSKDGTRVPYFMVAPKGMKLDGSHPTHLYAYGGFEVSQIPGYNAPLGRAWLSKGYVYVLANIRGGGEYGPRWHQAALKANRHKAYEDLAAVAEDLVKRGVTAPKHLGVRGGSNGGLLVGNMLTQYPGLFGAVVCQVPLLDMKRYSHLLAGASWMAEYGDPDKPEEWAFVQTFSPYHLVKADGHYPPTLFMTTTRDDRVHPAHARKMFAKMKDMGHDVLYFENVEGGHGSGADNRQTAHFLALQFDFMEQKLK